MVVYRRMGSVKIVFNIQLSGTEYVKMGVCKEFSEKKCFHVNFWVRLYECPQIYAIVYLLWGLNWTKAL